MWIGEDRDRLYVAKPAGLPVFPPHADPAGDALSRRLLALRPEQAGDWPPGFEAGVAHRLDTATSGLVLVARSRPALEALRAQFRAGVLRKLYRFRSAAEPGFDERVVELPIAHHPRRKDRMVVRRGPRTAHRGRWYPAWTRLGRLGHGWWEAEIRTGVTHQVRVHALAAGVPLDGDPIYGLPGTGPFVLHHLRVIAPDWASPEVPVAGPG